MLQAQEALSKSSIIPELNLPQTGLYDNKQIPDLNYLRLHIVSLVLHPPGTYEIIPYSLQAQEGLEKVKVIPELCLPQTIYNSFVTQSPFLSRKLRVHNFSPFLSSILLQLPGVYETILRSLQAKQ